MTVTTLRNMLLRILEYTLELRKNYIFIIQGPHSLLSKGHRGFLHRG